MIEIGFENRLSKITYQKVPPGKQDLGASNWDVRVCIGCFCKQCDLYFECAPKQNPYHDYSSSF